MNGVGGKIVATWVIVAEASIIPSNIGYRLDFLSMHFPSVTDGIELKRHMRGPGAFCTHLKVLGS